MPVSLETETAAQLKSINVSEEWSSLSADIQGPAHKDVISLLPGEAHIYHPKTRRAQAEKKKKRKKERNTACHPEC